jgi:hypothetical protein
MTEALQPALLRLATSLLLAGDMAMWIGPGRNIIARSWEDVGFGIKLTGVLADQGWGGWKMIGLPSVLRMTPQLLEKSPSCAISLLATLYREKKLGDVDMVWKQRVEMWVGSRLTEWERSEESVRTLLRQITLVVADMSDRLWNFTTFWHFQAFCLQYRPSSLESWKLRLSVQTPEKISRRLTRIHHGYSAPACELLPSAIQILGWMELTWHHGHGNL